MNSLNKNVTFLFPGTVNASLHKFFLLDDQRHQHINKEVTCLTTKLHKDKITYCEKKFRVKMLI